MIKRETCEKIWKCYREIETGTNLLKEVEEVLKSREPFSMNEPTSLKDAFGREQSLQLGIPSGQNSHRLFNVSYELAKPVIKAHIANSQQTLAELKQIVELELKEQSE